jgi:hypothetical protein
MVERIDTYKEFKRAVVEQDFQDFMADRGNLRKAWHCAGSLFHLHDRVYKANKKAIEAKYKFRDDDGEIKSIRKPEHFANSLGQQNPDFQLIRGIGNASKHFVLHPVPEGRINPKGMPSHAANTYVSEAAFQSTAFQANAFQTGDVKLQKDDGDIEFAVLAESVLAMWNKLFTEEGW